MSRSISLTRKAVFAALAVSVAAAGLAAPTSADAKPYPYYSGYKKPGWGYGPAYGYGAAALAGGLAVGAIAAGVAASDGACWIERRRVYDDFGNLYVRRIRVCE